MLVVARVVFVGGSGGTSPSLDLTFHPTGLSKNLGDGNGEGRETGKAKGGGEHLPYFPPLASASNTYPGRSEVEFRRRIGVEWRTRSRISDSRLHYIITSTLNMKI